MSRRVDATYKAILYNLAAHQVTIRDVSPMRTLVPTLCDSTKPFGELWWWSFSASLHTEVMSTLNSCVHRMMSPRV